MSSKVNLSDATTEFAVQLLKSLGGSGDKDVFFSPISIAIALGMTYAGAAGVTQQEFKKALFQDLKPEDVHSAFMEVLQVLNAKDAPFKLHTANRLYSHDKFKAKPEFTQTLAKQYHSDFRQVDFENKGEEARLEVNAWVADVTANRIRDLLASGVLNRDTKLIIVNAIYFKGDWQHQFEKHDTQKKPFHVKPGVDIQVNMMHASERYLYGENEECQVLGLPYRGEHLQMFVFLPKEQFGLTKMIQGLTGEKMQQWIKQMSREQVNVQFPKFRMEQEFRLNGTLADLGLKSLFDKNSADLSGISVEEKLSVSAVIHKAFIEVTEEGTEAAAATAVVCVCESLCTIIGAPPPKNFFVHHPAAISIHKSASEKSPQSYSIFLGCITKPPEA